MKRPWFATAVLLAASISGCGQPGKHDVLSVFDAESGDFRIRYLDPPWMLVSSERDSAHFRIDNNAARFAGIDASTAPKYELRVTVVGGDPRPRAERDARRAGSRDETVLDGPREVRTHAGDAGWEVVTRQETEESLYRRFVYLEHPRGAVRLLFESVPDVDEPEVDAMIGAAEVRP